MENKGTVQGVGYLNGEKPWKNRQYEYEYELWSGMINRCYGKGKDSEYYTNCSVSENFKDYSYFKSWCNKQTGFKCKDENRGIFHLDKDVLCKGEKIYSEETCCFIPAEINCAVVSPKPINKTLSLPLGVSKRKDRAKFSATLARYGKAKHLGSFTTVEDAEAAWKIAKSLYILELAEKWRARIDVRVYLALVDRAKDLLR